jgi:hypothetical protein
MHRKSLVKIIERIKDNKYAFCTFAVTYFLGSVILTASFCFFIASAIPSLEPFFDKYRWLGWLQGWSTNILYYSLMAVICFCILALAFLIVAKTAEFFKSTYRNISRWLAIFFGFIALAVIVVFFYLFVYYL